MARNNKKPKSTGRRPPEPQEASPAADFATGGPKRVGRLVLALAVVTVLVYAPSLSHPFVNYDDESYVVANEHIHAGLTPAMVRWAVTSFDQSNWHPLTWMSHALDCELFGLSPGGHHATSVLLHALNAGILFLLLCRATGATWRSLAVAALFAIHPLNVESVAWVAERKNVLSMFFLLVTLGAYGWYARRRGWLRYGAVVTLYGLGLAAKPMIVTLPFALLLLDYWPLRRVRLWSEPSEEFPLDQMSWMRLLWEKIPLLGLSAASCVITLYAQRVAMPPTGGLPLSTRLVNAAYSCGMYLWDTVRPVRLSVYYPYEGGHLGAWRVGLCVLLIIAISAWAWSRRSSQPFLLVGWLWFLGNLVPVIGLVQVGDQGRADRYVYLPLVGIFVMLAWEIATVLEGRVSAARDRRSAWFAVAGGVAAVFAGLGILTVRQIGTWRSSYDLWAHSLQVTENNYVAEDYAGTFVMMQAHQSGQSFSDKAAAHFRNATRINPRDAIGHLNLGSDFHARGELQKAIEQYTQTLECTQDVEFRTKAYMGLGAAYGQLHQFDRAGQFFRQAAQLEPDNRDVMVRMGEMAIEQKIAQFADAAAAHPNAQAYTSLAQLQQSAGRSADAATSYQQALKLDPKSAVARAGLANLRLPVE